MIGLINVCEHDKMAHDLEKDLSIKSYENLILHKLIIQSTRRCIRVKKVVLKPDASIKVEGNSYLS